MRPTFMSSPLIQKKEQSGARQRKRPSLSRVTGSTALPANWQCTDLALHEPCASVPRLHGSLHSAHKGLAVSGCLFFFLLCKSFRRMDIKM